MSVVHRSSFSEFALRHARDERFKAVEKMREREQLFAEYLQELKKTAAASGGRGRQRGGDRSATDHTASSAHPKPADKVHIHTAIIMYLCNFCHQA